MFFLDQLKFSFLQETDFKQNFNRTNSVLEDQTKLLDDRQREIETLNHLLTRLQLDYEKSKDDLSISHDQIVQHEISNQTLKQHLNEKTNEVEKTKFYFKYLYSFNQVSSLTTRLQQIQQNLHAYEKEHRYSNEEYFEREQRLKLIENELSTIIHNYEKLQGEHSILNEQLTKYRNDFDKLEKSDHSHKEQVNKDFKDLILANIFS